MSIVKNRFANKMGFGERLVGGCCLLYVRHEDRWGSGSTAPVILNVGLRWRLVQLHSLTVLPPHKEAVWATGSLSLCDF
jgi:hypothetical protein